MCRCERMQTRFALSALALFLCVSLADAWGWKAHEIVNLKAVIHLPPVLADLKADSLFYSIHSTDADNRKDYDDTSFYAETQRHFIDIDWYPSYMSMPRALDTLIMMYGRDNVWYQGTLPWATLMAFDSLVQQLARGDRASAAQTMSDLGHYVADAHQPLHCAVNYNGQLTGNNGIHSRYESGMVNTFAASIAFQPDSVLYISSVRDFVFSYIYHAYSLADSIMIADDSAKAASGWNGSGTPPQSYYTALWQRLGSLTQDQLQRATVALASLWYTAWVDARSVSVAQRIAPSDPHGFMLYQNFPNPFNPSTVIRYVIASSNEYGVGSKEVKLVVCDILGREMATLVNETQRPGTYVVRWDASHVSSGVYCYRLQAGSFSESKKLVVLK